MVGTLPTVIRSIVSKNGPALTRMEALLPYPPNRIRALPLKQSAGAKIVALVVVTFSLLHNPSTAKRSPPSDLTGLVPKDEFRR
jgi:hypothetical protein